MPRRAHTAQSSIYQLKVTLEDVKPPIWRRLLVPGNISFAQLHDILQVAMGWADGHLHLFEVGNERIGVRGGDLGVGSDVEDERRVRLDQMVRTAKTRFSYEYDFGDSWIHDIVVEKILAPEEGAVYPRCVEGKRACPPEDCGGAWGYEDLLGKLANPEDEEHAETLEWVGEGFDPERFAVEEVNARLARLGG